MEQKKARSDADRRARQSERLGRLLRVLALISGSGRWDAGSLSRELECSPRTIHRLLQSLSHAGVPWFFDDERRAYRVRPGFKYFKYAENKQTQSLLEVSKRLEMEVERFLNAIRQFNENMERM